MKLIAQITAALLLAWIIERAVDLLVANAALPRVTVGAPTILDEKMPPLPTLPKPDATMPTAPIAPPQEPPDTPRPRTPYTLPSAQDCNTPDNPRCSIHRSSSGP